MLYLSIFVSFLLFISFGVYQFVSATASFTKFTKHSDAGARTCSDGGSVMNERNVINMVLCACKCSKINNCNAFLYLHQSKRCTGCRDIYSMIDDTSSKSDEHYYRYRTFRYRFVEEEKQWDNARIFCKDLGGHLVTIKTQQEETFILNNVIPGSDADNDKVWIGATDLDITGTYLWQDGTKLTDYYQNWKPGQPNKEDEHCIMISKHDGEWFWRDDVCGIKRKSICEFD